MVWSTRFRVSLPSEATRRSSDVAVASFTSWLLPPQIIVTSCGDGFDALALGVRDGVRVQQHIYGLSVGDG